MDLNTWKTFHRSQCKQDWYILVSRLLKDLGFYLIISISNKLYVIDIKLITKQYDNLIQDLGGGAV